MRLCKNELLLLIAVNISAVVFGQTDKVQGTLSTVDTAELTILNIYPESFPNVSVVFKAERRNGEPVWNLTKEKMKVRENSQNCDVISIEQISRNRPINLGIVIDHSGSMMEDAAQLFDRNGNPLFTYDRYNQPILPEGYITPIDKAKSAIGNFVTSFNSAKDFISVIGFSGFVDKKLPLTQDITQIKSIVDSMKADYSTALYDGMIAGIEEIKKAEGIKVLVVLTDGQDNSSKSKLEDVVEHANRENIPVYIIGLGSVNTQSLQHIANSTKGQFYYTQSSVSLDTVYAAISKRVQAFYELVYSSPNLLATDSSRQIELSFDIDSIYLVTNPETSNFPPALVELMEKKERDKQYLVKGEVFVLALLAAGTLLFYYQRKKRNESQPVIKKVYPNPTNGILNLNYESSTGQVQILNFSGQLLRTFEICGEEMQIDLTDLESGNYFALIQASGQQSNTIEFIIQK